MPSAPRRFPTSYGYPVYKLIMNLPFLSCEKRVALARKWQSVGPTAKIRQGTRWYRHHDWWIILALRVCVAALPVVLTSLGVGVELILTGLVIGLFVTRALARKREALERTEWIEDAYDAHRDMLQDERDTDPTV
jgi:hypothetical protein